MYLTTLADVARRTGHKVVEIDGWRTRGHGEMKSVKTVVLHHTAGPTGRTFPSREVLINGRADLPGPLCHYGIDRDGTIYVIAAGKTYHAGNTFEPAQGNSYSVGIEVEHCGTSREPWSEPVLDAMRKLSIELCREYGIKSDRVQGHKEVASPKGRKIDPYGIDMAAFRQSLVSKKATPRLFIVTGAVGAASLAAAFGVASVADLGVTSDQSGNVTPGAVVTATTAPTTAVPVAPVPTVTATATVTVTATVSAPAPVTSITRTLKAGASGEDVRILQRKLGVAADGKYGRKTALAVERFQKNSGLKADGIVGPQTRKALGL